jgi:hypothetical protein
MVKPDTSGFTMRCGTSNPQIKNLNTLFENYIISELKQFPFSDMINLLLGVAKVHFIKSTEFVSRDT